jgi:5-methylcytosine-specific restriction endonuclease McrA
MSKVFVLDTNHRQLAPCSQRKAKKLLRSGKAAVYKLFPFTIILKYSVTNPTLPSLRLKIDPGSKTTGLAIVNDGTGEVVWAALVGHRGDKVKASFDSRRAVRRSRQSRKTRYRKVRFCNRTRKAGWLPPSLESRISNITTWVERLRRLCPIQSISQELVKFDLQLMDNPEISGLEYQQGELAGYEVKEYLLQKFGHKCAYCRAENIPLQVEHITPRSRGGTDRVSNLTIACNPCNQKKGNRTAEEFGYPEVQALAKAPLKDAAAVNATRLELFRRLQASGLTVEVGSGGLTKYNRSRQGLEKSHWADAACVGLSTPKQLKADDVKPLRINAVGHGSRQMCRMDKFGFPRTSKKAGNKFFGFRSGDIVKAVVKVGKKVGTYLGKVAVRASGYFNIVTKEATIQGISHKYCRIVHFRDGYSY